MAQPRVVIALVAGLLPMLQAAASRGAEVPKERRLHVASAEASSYLVNDWNKFQENYLPLYVGDDDPKTAWTLKTEGIGEWLRAHVTPMAGATKVRLKVRNGYQKTDKLWAANSRAKGLTVVLLPSKKTVDVELTDTKGWQEIAVEQPAGAFDAFELHVRSVYPGKKYDDLCLSDVQIFATATTPDNPAFEKQRLQKLLDWKKERLAAAALFKSELGASMPVAAQYTSSGGDEGQGPQAGFFAACKNENDSSCWFKQQLTRALKSAGGKAKAPSLEVASAIVTTRFAGMTAVRISTRDQRPLPRVDGVCTRALDTCSEDPCYQSIPLPAELGYLDARSLVTTEQSGLPTVEDALSGKPPACKRAGQTTFAYVQRGVPGADGSPGPIQALLLVKCGMVEGREGLYPAKQPQLLVYGPSGALDVSASESEVALLSWQGRGKDAKLAAARVTDSSNETPIVITASSTIVAGE